MRDQCRDALDHLWSFLDGEEPGESAESIRDHLETCEPCLGEYEFQEALKMLVRRSCRESAPAALRARIVTEIARQTSVTAAPGSAATYSEIRQTTQITSVRVIKDS